MLNELAGDHSSVPRKRPDHARQHILLAAARLFHRRGYPASTMRDIAFEADMKAGSIYYHFKSKDELLDEVLDLGLRDIYNGVLGIIESSEGQDNYRERITAVIHEHLTQLLTASAFSSANIRIYGQLPKSKRLRHQPLRHAYSGLWEGLLKEAQDAGQLRKDIKIAPLRQFVLGALNWTVEWFDAEKYSVDIMADQVAKIVLDGIVTGGASELNTAASFLPKPPAMPKVPLKKSDYTRESILLASAGLFRQQGYTAATLREIAKAANVKAGSVYYHFGSKDEILDEVLDRGLRDIYFAVRHICEICSDNDDCRARFSAAVHEHLTQLLALSEFTSANIRIFSQLPPEKQALHQPLRRAYSKLWDGLLKELKSAGYLSDNTPIVPTRQYLLGALNWTVEWFDADKYSIDDLADRSARLLLDGVFVKGK